MESPFLMDYSKRLEHKKIKEKAGDDVKIKVDVDASLIAGFIVTIGSVVVDASLKYKIQKAMRKNS